MKCSMLTYNGTGSLVCHCIPPAVSYDSVDIIFTRLGTAEKIKRPQLCSRRPPALDPHHRLLGEH